MDSSNISLTNSDQLASNKESNYYSTNQLFKFRKFPSIEDDLIIPLQSFLDSCRSLIEFVTILGPVFKLVRSDIAGNVEKLNKISLTNPSKFTTINSIIHSETSLPIDKQIGTDALLWLTRALQYMETFLQYLVDDFTNGITENDLTKHFIAAYDSTLRKHHNWIVQNLVHLSLKAAPSRSTIINLILPEISSNSSYTVNDKLLEKNLYTEIDDYRKLVSININSIHKLYDNLNIDY